MSNLDNTAANGRNLRAEASSPANPAAEQSVPTNIDHEAAPAPGATTNADLPAAVRKDSAVETEVSPRHATLQLGVALDTMRIANGKMTDLIDEIASKSNSKAQNDEAILEKAVANSVWTEIVTGKIPGMRYGTELNIEGSLFFESSQGEVRYRWRGGASRCDIYVGGHDSYFASNGSDYIAPRRIANTRLYRELYSESEERLDRRVKHAERVAEETYQKALDKYNSTPQTIARFVSGFLGKSEDAPVRVTVSKEDMSVTIPEPDGRTTGTIKGYQTIATIATAAAEGIENAHDTIRDRLNAVRRELTV